MAALPQTRSLRLRAGTVSIVTQAGTTPWDDHTAVMLEDGFTATLDMNAATDGDKLQVLFPAASEVLFPHWEVTGLEVRVRGACIGNTNPALSPPSLGLRILPGEGNVYASQERIVPLQYLAQASAWIIAGGEADLWSIPDVYHVAQDAATIGLLVEVDPKPWTQRPATLAIDAVELVLHLQAAPFPGSDDEPMLAPSLARVQHERFVAYGEEPAALDPGALAVNHAEGQLWVGAPNGTPVPLITFRGVFSSARRYRPGQVVIVNNVLYLANVEKAAGAGFVAANWTALS